MFTLGSLQFQLCDIQGRLFELALRQGYDSKTFIFKFMTSKAAAALDDVYDRLQWAGEEYILEELNDEIGGLPRSDNLYHNEMMFWTGYIYRYWHYYTGESSAEIVKIAPPEVMALCWLGYHTLDCSMAIDRLKEDYEAKTNR